MAIAKVILNGVTQMDVTQKTVTANTMLNGTTALKNDGTDVTGNIASKTSSDLTVSGATVTAPAGMYASSASASIPWASTGRPTATKGTVSNHSVSVTPSFEVTSDGYIDIGTISGTAVSVSASELVSGTLSITSSGTSDVTNYASASVSAQTLPTTTSSTSSGTSKATVTPGTANKYINIPTGYNSSAAYYTVSGDANLVAGNIKSGTSIFGVTGSYTGGGGSATVDTKTMTNSSNTATSISFTGLGGTPKAFWVRCTTTLTRSSSYRYYYVATMRYNGTNTTGNRWYMYNGQFSNITSGYSYTYSNGTLTLSSSGGQSTSPGAFYNGTYELVYVY